MLDQELTPAEELAMALRIASENHYGQYDKGGAPYILHPIKVMHYLKTDDYQLMAIAMLHDVVEDSDITIQDLLTIGFSIRVIKAVDLLTKRKGMSHEQYLQGILSNIDAIKTKKADLRHNSDIRRLKGVTEKDLKRIEKYHKMYTILKEAEENFYTVPSKCEGCGGLGYVEADVGQVFECYLCNGK